MDQSKARRVWWLAGLAAILVMPLVVNVLGWGVYVYLNVGSRHLVFAAAAGVSHNAVAEHHGDFDYADAALGLAEWRRTLIDAGSLLVFVEKPGEFAPYRFHMSADPGYLAVEFPWVLLPLAPALLAVRAWRLARSEDAHVKPATPAVASDAGEPNAPSPTRLE